MKRKVSKDSTYNVSKKACYGDQLFDEGNPWTNKKDDALLEGCLVYLMFYQSERQCYLRLLGRSPEAISSRLWKLAVRYRNLDYKPCCRTDRNGTQFTLRDLAIIEVATSPIGRKNMAYDVSYLSKLLGRKKKDLRAWMTKQMERVVIKFKDKKETEEEYEARMIHLLIAGSFKSMQTTSGISHD